MGDTIDIHCRMSDVADITWSKVTGRFADNVYVSGPSMRITSLRPENEGYYRCEANGYHGAQTKDYKLTILGMETQIFFGDSIILTFNALINFY